MARVEGFAGVVEEGGSPCGVEFVEEAGGLIVGVEQSVQFGAEGELVGARFVEEGCALGGGPVEGLGEEGFDLPPAFG